MNNPLRFWRKQIKPTIHTEDLALHARLPHKAAFRVQGMHCASCVVRVERKLKQIEGVQQVEVDITTGKAELLCLCVPSVETLHQAVQTDGYAIVAWEEEERANAAHADK